MIGVALLLNSCVLGYVGWNWSEQGRKNLMIKFGMLGLAIFNIMNIAKILS